MPSLAHAAGTKLPAWAPTPRRAGGGREGGGPALDGRLAPHGRSGDQPQPIVRTDRQIVGDEALAGVAQRRFDDRMTAGFNLQAGLVGQLGPHPTVFGSALRVARRDVDPGDRFSGCGDLQSRCNGKPRSEASTGR